MYGFIFTARILLNKKELRRDTLYLGLVVFFMSMSNLQYWLLDTGITEEHQILQYTYIPWQWLVLPMFYNYVFSFLGKKNNGFSFKLKNLTPILSFLPLYLLVNLVETRHQLI